MIDRREFIEQSMAAAMVLAIPPDTSAVIPAAIDSSSDEEDSTSFASSCSCTGICKYLGGCPGYTARLIERAENRKPRMLREHLARLSPEELRNHVRFWKGVSREEMEPTPIVLSDMTYRKSQGWE